MTEVYSDTRSAERNRRKIEDRAVRQFREGARGLDLRQGYKRNLISRIRAAENPGREARRFLRQLALTHRNEASTLPDLSAATEARASLLRRQPPDLRRWPAFEDEIGKLERALLKGHVSQKVFDGRCRKIADRPLPSWMTMAGEAEMSLERRLQKLEAQQPDENRVCHRIIVEVGQSQEEAIRQYFGERGPPENAFLILRTIVDPPPRREAP